ncbi:hypothetical protein RRG08_027994 [Elysia crispata]|uniref:Uncharacterized protein n=1 Tax=Elysia crispata TaxID=231223 RepID=A0AAE1EDM6_9GAST|nr:hypothetical protein RRG08_027994 [Elysia crispata]
MIVPRDRSSAFSHRSLLHTGWFLSIPQPGVKLRNLGIRLESKRPVTGHSHSLAQFSLYCLITRSSSVISLVRARQETAHLLEELHYPFEERLKILACQTDLNYNGVLHSARSRKTIKVEGCVDIT